MQDKIIVCQQCGGAFSFSWQQQEKYARQGFSEPRRCPACRKHKSKTDSQPVEREGRREKRSERRRRDVASEDF